jgi:hypothetical protein
MNPIDADLQHGVCAVALAACAALHTRICRPVGLAGADRERAIRFALQRIGDRDDLRDVIDLARGFDDRRLARADAGGEASMPWAALGAAPDHTRCAAH